jgi:pimeloyl-ACP methyl ester carboxylesterase
VPRRLSIPIALLAVAAAGLATSSVPASAAAEFRPCRNLRFVLCSTVDVPLDRAGAVPGKIGLHVRRIRAPRPGGAVFAFAGGPGQAATPFTELVAELFGPILRSRDLVVFDQRGTGHSGLIRCPTLEGVSGFYKVNGATADCAEVLGARHSFYTTRDTVEDIEAVRRAIGVPRITLYGVSYGTKVALAYAAAYPQQVERLILDSVVEPGGPDAFGLEFIAAVPRMLRLLCARGCERITPDPNADLEALVQKLGKGLLRGPLVTADGRRREARLGRVRLLDLLAAGDFDPTLRAGLPAALRSAAAGDAAPILRLSARAGQQFREPIGIFNPAIFAATVCEEGPLPWARTADPAARTAQALALLSRVPDAALRPFDRSSAVAQSILQLCRLWPAAPAEPTIFARPLPDVPALLLAGEDDLRTPLEGARRVAAAMPRATLLPVPDIGHDVLGFDAEGCSLRALRAFMAGRPVKQCKRRTRLFRPDPLAPTALERVPPVGAVTGRPGRTLAAVERTLHDVAIQLTAASLSIEFVPGFGGLRGGHVRFAARGLVLRNVEYVPGVRVSGVLKGERRVRGVLRVSGGQGASGRLRLRSSRLLVGRLEGRHVRHRVPARAVPGPLPVIEEFVLSPAAAMRRSGHVGAAAGGELFR